MEGEGYMSGIDGNMPFSTKLQNTVFNFINREHKDNANSPT